jgi:hypothetical protein
MVLKSTVEASYSVPSQRSSSDDASTEAEKTRIVESRYQATTSEDMVNTEDLAVVIW